MNKNILAIGIVTLFIVSSVTPMVFGYNAKSVDTELDKMLDDLRFVCSRDNGFDNAKFERYKELLLEDYSKDGIVIEQEEKSKISMPVEPPAPVFTGGPMDSPWPMQSHDTHHTGQSQYSTADNPGTEKWRYGTNNWIDDGPVIDTEGIIYFGCFNYYLYAIYPDEMLKWRYYTSGNIIGSSPAIAEDGTIYVGSWDDYLYAINPDGTRKWRFGAGSNIASSPAIADDGTIYFGVMGPGSIGRIFAVNPNGTEEWHYDTGYWIASDPAIADDGTIYIGSGDSHLYAMNPNGTLKWLFHTDDEIHSNPSIAEDGTIYIGSNDGYLYAVYPNGTMKWKSPMEWGMYNSASIANDGTIYAGDVYLHAIYPNNGTKKWTLSLGDERWVGHSSPAISADGTIYIGTHIGEGAGGEIIAINPDGTEKWRNGIANKWVDSSPAIAEDGTVYIGSAHDMGTGYLHAFGVGELEANANGPYYGLTNQPVQFTGSSSSGHSPYSHHWDFGDTGTSEEQNPTHTYTNPGDYDVILTVTDNESNTATDTTYAWIQTSNTAPNKPTIDGPTNGKAGVPYDYTFSAADPDGSIIYLYIEWGDNTFEEWIGPYNSGQQATVSHTWSNRGAYIIRAKAKDPYNAESEWAQLEVTMPVNQNIQINSQQFTNPLFFQILQRILNIR